MSRLKANSLRVMGLSLVLACPLCSAQTLIPKLHGTSLAGTTVTLPDTSAHVPALLIVGFSKKSTDAATLWAKRARSAAPGSALTIYTLPVLVEVPHFLRGIVLHAMRREVPAGVQPQFVPILDHEMEWKQAAKFAKPDDVYILLIDPQGAIRWRADGPVTDARITEMLAGVKAISG
jgi:hypothetical protein